jgi:hypothetical protein
MTLLSFAISLFLGIVGLVIGARIRGVPPNMPLAYGHIALPAAAVVGAVVLVSSIFMEIRHFRQSKALASIERAHGGNRKEIQTQPSKTVREWTPSAGKPASRG